MLPGLLDLICKSVYSLFLLRARLFTEDWLVETGLIDIGLDSTAADFQQELTKMEYSARQRSGAMAAIRVEKVRRRCVIARAC